jgi:alpha-acetolactate decarboxylase
LPGAVSLGLGPTPGFLLRLAPLLHIAIPLVGTACSPDFSREETLPAPTGPHGTGRRSHHWVDAGREELETRAAGDRRELMAHLFYPAAAGDSGDRAPYVPDADAMRGPWNDEQVARIAAMRAFSREGAPLSDGEDRYPVAVFLPGGGMKALTYHALLEDLASHGWVVAAIDPPYNARAVRFPDGRVLGNLPAPERGWPPTRNPEEERRFYRERIVHWSGDVSFVIDQMTALDRGEGPFARRLDLARGVGVFGHSRGGQAAGTVRMLDDRVRGGINIDGTAGEYPFQPAKGEETSGSPPFLWIQQPLPEPPTEEQLRRARRTRAEYDAEIERILAAWNRRLRAVAGGAMRVTIDRPGITHIDFSDEPFWDGSMTPETRPGKLATVADTRAWVRAFFDGTVRGVWADLERLVREAGTSRPEVTLALFGRLWPESGARAWDGEVRVHGSLRAMFHEGKTGATVTLGAMLPDGDLYAVGALADLAGEVTIVGGKVYLSYPDGEGLARCETTSRTDAAATLLVAADVPEWRSVVTGRAIPFEDLDEEIARIAASAGLSRVERFPFLVEGTLQDLEWHVIDGSRRTGGGASHADHLAAAVKAKLDHASGSLVGFYSRSDQGVFTHMGASTHVHCALDAPLAAGHVDRVTLPAGATVKIPAD